MDIKRKVIKKHNCNIVFNIETKSDTISSSEIWNKKTNFSSMLQNGNSTILLMNNNPNLSILVNFFGFDETYETQQSYK